MNRQSRAERQNTFDWLHILPVRVTISQYKSSSANGSHILPVEVIFCQYRSYILQSCSVEIIGSLTVNFVLFCRSALLCRFNIGLPNYDHHHSTLLASAARDLATPRLLRSRNHYSGPELHTVTQSNPSHQLTVQTQPTTLQVEKFGPNPTQLTIELKV